MANHPHKHDVYISNKKVSAIFNVDELIDFAKNYRVTSVDINDLECEFYDQSNQMMDNDTENRINNADLTYPVILVSNRKEKIIAVLDGTHRIRKAIKSGYKTIQAIIIPKRDMKRFRASRKLSKIIRHSLQLTSQELELLKILIEDYLEDN